jgi:branched-chain amino acid transport system permease protein
MLAQLLVSGASQGALYALVALAMTVVYRATTVINFGHGDFVMIGAFVVYLLVVLAGVPFLGAALLALTLLFAFGWAVYSGLIRPIMIGPHLALAMMAVAVGYALRGAARVIWGREVLPFPKVLPQGTFTVGPVILSASDLIVTGAVVVTVAILALVFYATPFGKTAQAIFQSERGAALIGINVPAFQGMIWGIGAGMAALGGILIAPVTLLYPDFAASVLIRGFAAMTLGGFGSFLGAAVGGVLLGVGELVVGAYLSSKLIDITSYLIIIAVLLVRPRGLFGRQVAVRV